MNTSAPRPALLPWYIGLVIIVLSVVYVGYQFYATSCAAAPFLQFGVLVIIPVVYLALMYLTFRSQS